MLCEDAIVRQKKHKHALPAGDKPDASFFLLVPLCCPLLEQPADNQLCLDELD